MPEPVTVAAIREHPAPQDVEVVFLESARFYRLRREHPRFDELLETLRRARGSGQRVELTLSKREGDVIEDACPE